MALSPPPVDLYAYSPPVSLWSLVEAHVPESEQDEIKGLLGYSLVEQSLELHQEVEMLLEIWRDYRDETEHLACNKLPEPPHMRERLVQEIQFYLENIRDKARENGHDPDRMLSHHNTEILDYVMGNRRPGSASRPSTARSILGGRDTPVRQSTPGSDGMSLGSTLSEEVESMNDKLNILKLDEVSQHLRQTLEDEVELLLGDLRFLQGCLEDEAEYRSDSKTDNNPSIADLREERSKLEQDMLHSDSSLPYMPDMKRNQPASHKESNKKTADLLPGARRRSSGTCGAVRSIGPLKASHNIALPGMESSMLDTHRSHPGSTRPARNRPSSGRREGSQHVTLRCESPRVVRVVTLPTQPNVPSGDLLQHQPTPPKDARPTSIRPSSADRFRRMVIDARDT